MGKKHSQIPCRFFMQGPLACKNGALCPFSHDPRVIEAASGSGPTRNDPTTAKNYKTTLCLHFKNGTCTRGATCQFAHGVHELKEVEQEVEDEESKMLSIWKKTPEEQPEETP